MHDGLTHDNRGDDELPFGFVYFADGKTRVVYSGDRKECGACNGNGFLEDPVGSDYPGQTRACNYCVDSCGYEGSLRIDVFTGSGGWVDPTLVQREAAASHLRCLFPRVEVVVL